MKYIDYIKDSKIISINLKNSELEFILIILELAIISLLILQKI